MGNGPQPQKAVQEAIAQTEQEIERVEAILAPFTKMTVSEAIETLNSHKYKGHGSWKFGEGGITDGSGNTVSMQEAVDIASLLRREEYVTQRTSPEK